MSPSWLLWGACGLAAVAGLAALGAWLPVTDAPHSLCLTRRALGVPCAGCGMTRAVAALARGRLGDALELHPLSPVFVVEAGLVWLLWAARNAGLVWRPPSKLVWIWLVANGALLLIVWILRFALGVLPA